MKIWLDDLRPPPDNSWTVCKTAAEAFSKIMSNEIECISFDHDLGSTDPDKTGYHVACLIEKLAFAGLIERLSYYIHSANPVGRENIRMAMENADIFWKADNK